MTHKKQMLLTAALVASMMVIAPPESIAHWCSNIYQTYARIVVKPERQNINIGVGETGTLRVRVRNNFPYALRFIKLRANNPSGLTVSVSPTESEAAQKVIYPGQEETFVLTITRDSSGSDDVSSLNLEVATSVQSISESWRDMSDTWLDQNPDPAEMRNSIENGEWQSRALLNADLAIQSCAGCETDGVNGLLTLWHDRVDSCDSEITPQYPNTCLRAGQALAVRLRFMNFNDPTRQTVVQNMIDVMDDENPIARGYAAFLAAYGGNDAGVEARIQSMADSDPEGSHCSYSSSADAQLMAKAALLMLGHNEYHGEVTSCYTDGGNDDHVRFACAAALGVMGEDDPITNYLIGELSNGSNTNYVRLFADYLFQLVVFVRRGGLDGTGVVSFLDEDVVIDDTPPMAPANLVAGPPI